MSVAAYSGPDSELTPNAQAIIAFLRWWFAFCNHGQIEIGWMDSGGLSLVHFARFELSSNEIVPTIVQANLIPGQSVYFRASTVNTIEGNTKDENFVQAPGVWGDIDTPEQMEKAKSVQSIVRPNGSVITGTHPHMRVQSWFRVSEPIVNPDLVRSLNRRIHKLYGGDPAVVNPTRLMRMPGTIAWPWKDGRVPELTTFIQDPARQKSYPLSMLTSQLPAEEEPGGGNQSSSQAKTEQGGGGFTTASDLIRAIQSNQQWHNNTLRLTAHWIGRGWSNTEILLASEPLTLPGWTVTQTRAEVSKMIESGRAKWGVADNDPIIGMDPAAPFAGEVVDFWDTLTPPEFPIHVLPDVLQRFVEGRARAIGGDPCAIAFSALSAASAALHGAIRLQMKRREKWLVPPALWVALVGRSSTKKTPITMAGWSHLERLQADDLSKWMEQLNYWKALPKEEQKKIQQPPPPRRLVSHNNTMEAIREILSIQSRGIGVLSDELSGWLAGMDKYANGKGGADRAFYLQAYNGAPYVADRTDRAIPISNLLATICGGIQFDKLLKLTDIGDDGLWQRFIPLIVRDPEIGEDDPDSSEIPAYEDMINRLLSARIETMQLSDPAHEVRRNIELELFELERGEALGSKFASFCGKLAGVWGRLCLVLSKIEPTGMGFIVGPKTAEAARVLVMRCIVPHAAQIYLMMGDGPGNIENTRGIAGYILTKKLTRVLVSDLTRNVRACRNRTVGDVQQMVSTLVAGGWLTPEREGASNHAWLVNPKVHVMFADRAAREEKRRRDVRALITGEEEEE